MEGTEIFPMTLKQYFECTALMEYLVKAELQNTFLFSSLPLALLVRGGGVEQCKEEIRLFV